MPLVFRYSDPGGAEEPAVTVDLGNTITTVRLGTLALSQAAELGDVAMSGIEIEDPDGTLDLVGLRGFRVEETSAPSNSRWIFNGPIGDQRISRGDSTRPSIRLGASRVWSIDLSDQNWSLGVSIITGSDGNRPAETAGERLRWVIRQYSRVKDYGHVTYPSTAMDACDYRHQTVKDVIADCALPGGYNYWVDRFEAQNHPELFFMLPTSSDYASAITISNVFVSVDNATVFAPAIEAELVRSPSRITYGVDLQYDGGSVYVTNSTTGNQFAFVDQSAPMANVKSSAKATVIANRFLADNDEQDERVTCSIKVPAAQVNDLRHGHRVNNVTFSHLPGWESGRDCRVLRRTVVQEESGGEAWYRLDLELSPVSVAVASCSTALAAIEQHHSTGTGSPGADTITPTVDGTLVSMVIGSCANGTQDPAGFGAPAGYTILKNVPILHRTSYVVASKAVTAGVGSTISVTIPPPGLGAVVWHAMQILIPTATTSPVQDAFGSGGDTAILSSDPTPGNLLVFLSEEDVAAHFYGPGAGWTELFTYDETLGQFSVSGYARCVQAGDGRSYEFTAGGSAFAQSVYLMEWAIT